MFLENTFKLTMENGKAANTALKMIKKVFTDSEERRGNCPKSFADNLAIEGSEIILTDEYGCFFYPEETVDVFENVLKAIAKRKGIQRFECTSSNQCDCSANDFEASYENGTLRIKNTYYPSGWYDSLDCPECCEEIMRLEDYASEKEYICPYCGEVIDLSKVYEEVAPIVEEKEFIIQ